MTPATSPSSAEAIDPAKSRREAVESIVIAIVLAFLFRAFEAEAFVIPTGSMAPTLQGRHKDIACPECGYQFQAGASLDTEYMKGPVQAVTCPMCFHEAEVEASDPNHESHTGDRILVNKFAYEPPFGNPERWDVIVFKYPGNAKQNYIKRLVGLENETVRIHHGDIFVKPVAAADSEFQIARKDTDKLVNMLQLVHDTQHLAETLRRVEWPSHWQPHGQDSAWTSPDVGVTHVCQSTPATSWLHYHHYHLDHDKWSAILVEANAGRSLRSVEPLEVPITDFYAYNAQSHRVSPRSSLFEHPMTLGYHWVGDLAVEADVDVEGDAGTLILELVEAGRRHTCTLDVATGQAKLSIADGSIPFRGPDGAEAAELTAETSVRGAGSYELRLANVDDELTLWVNGRVVSFGQPTTYGPTLEDRPAPPRGDDPGDLQPARIGALNLNVKLTRLRLLRDIYYIATNSQETPTDYRRFSEQTALAHLMNPAAWRAGDVLDQRSTVDFAMQADQFFPLGDNSPYSRDGRMWGVEHYVERDMLIGKAVMIYWPHAWRIRSPVNLPLFGRSIPVWPNFRRFGLIH